MRKTDRVSCPFCPSKQAIRTWRKRTAYWKCAGCEKEWPRMVYESRIAKSRTQVRAVERLHARAKPGTKFHQRMDARGHLILELHEGKSVRTIRIGRKGGLTLMNCAEDRLVTGPDVLTAKTY